jgi:hypothetical protein
VSTGKRAPTFGFVLASMFNWMAQHKTTESATKDIWEVLQALCPGGDVGTFELAKKMIKMHIEQTSEVFTLFLHVLFVDY